MKKPILPGWRHIIHSYPNSPAGSSSHSRYSRQQRGSSIVECRFEQKSITNNFNCFLDCSWGIRQFPKLFQTGMSCWFYRNLWGQFTLGIGFALQANVPEQVGRRWQWLLTHPQLWCPDLIRNLFSTETTAPYNPMSQEFWSSSTFNAAFSETSLTLSRFPDKHPQIKWFLSPFLPVTPHKQPTWPSRHSPFPV